MGQQEPPAVLVTVTDASRIGDVLARRPKAWPVCWSSLRGAGGDGATARYVTVQEAKDFIISTD
ncbi:hypothetical protein [Streptomyces prasinus]|nr:hypothetical protein [Streptomyces prasinus]